jgi:hypothetical protein
MTTRWTRVVRGLVAASVAVFVADFAHVAGGGDAPGFAGIALALAFSTLVCIALAGRRLARWRVAASVILSQGAFHLLFQVLGTPSPSLPMRGMQMTPLVVTGGSDHAPDSVWMWAAHGVAAGLTIVALFWGESALGGLWASARLALTRALRVPLVIASTPHQLPVVDAIAQPHIARFLITGLRHRGPPLAAAAPY